MTSYRLIWEIDIEAESPVVAAQEALAIQRRTDSTATVFDVMQEDQHLARIDLYSGESTMSYSDWCKMYQPVPNAYKNSDLWGVKGEDFDFVQSVAKPDPHRIWTVFKDAHDEVWVVPGLKYIGALGYLVTNKSSKDFPKYGKVAYPEYELGMELTIGEPSNDN